MKAYIVKKYVLVHDWAPHPVHTWTAIFLEHLANTSFMALIQG